MMTSAADNQRAYELLTAPSVSPEVTPIRSSREHLNHQSGYTFVIHTQPSDKPQTFTLRLEDHIRLPKPGTKSRRSLNAQEASHSLEDKAKSGKPTPSTIQKILSITLKGAAIILGVIGIGLLIGGTIYTCYVLGTNISKVKEIGVFGVVKALITSGAVPSILFGIALFHAACGMWKWEPGNTTLGNASLLSFVTPVYGLIYDFQGNIINPDVDALKGKPI